MLLFSDGFETYNIYDVGYKWGGFSWQGTAPKIVSGIEPSTGKPYATKNGRALYLGSIAAGLITTFRPSRTIYFGFAVRTRELLTLQIYYLAHAAISRSNELSVDLNWGASPATSVSRLTLTINRWNVGISQTFSGATTQVGDINTTMDMHSGDYHYVQVAMTLAGNESAQPRAWLEVRIGNRLTNRLVIENILTSAPDNTATYAYLNGLVIRSGFSWSDGNNSHQSNLGVGTAIDDVYVCNDEGDFNNTFLGAIKVRRMIPVADGIDLDAAPTLKAPDARRFQTVDEDFIDTTQVLPSPLPEDPLFITWEKGTDDYLTLAYEGDRESLRFTGGEFGGSSPAIFGAVLHALARAQYRNVAGSTVLTGYKRQGEFPTVDEANPSDTPLVHSPTALLMGGWRSYPMTFDNTEVVELGQPYQIWSAAGIAAAEFGVELAKSEIDPAMLDPNLVRFNLVFDQILYDGMNFNDTTHRFFEDPIEEVLSLAETELSYQYTWHVKDSLYWDDQLDTYRTFPKFLDDTMEFEDFMPWLDSFVGEFLGFDEGIWFQWLDVIEDGFGASDWTDGFWEELFPDSMDIADEPAISFILFLDDTFGLEEPYLWDGHEDVGEVLEIGVSYLWDGHELTEEYLHPDDNVELTFFYDETLAEEMAFAEEHFDGWWAEQKDDYVDIGDSIKTQQWRYQRFWGIVINSWQVEPVEEPGAMDGDHTGDNPWGA